MGVIGQGAEAILTIDGEGVRKSRPAKGYRHPALDTQLRTARTKAEARLLSRAKAAGVTVPAVEVLDDHTLRMTLAPGVQVRDVLDRKPELSLRVGEMLAKLHDTGIIHADLTTSNLLYDEATDALTMIDFGLSFHSERIEDRAVDLHLFRQSLESKHHRVARLAWREFLRGYRTSPLVEETLARLKRVEARGRNKGS